MDRSREPDWAWLPGNVLYVILTELFLLSDMVSFGTVCRNWSAVFRQRFQELRILSNMSFSRRLPMLLIPAVEDPGSRNLYSLPDGQIYDLRLPVPYNTRYIGSCHGWLIFLESVSFVITLFNPFYFGNSKGIVKLPPLQAARDYFETIKEFDFSPDYYITKAVLSADPVTSTKFTLMIIHGEFRRLAYYKSGDENWTCIPGSPLFSDLIYTNGRFTAVSLRGELYSSDTEANLPHLVCFMGPLYARFRSTVRSYIVLDRNSRLLQVVRTVEFFSVSNSDAIYRTRGFMVYMLALMNGVYDWVELQDIGDTALFVGDSYSYSVRASAFTGIKRLGFDVRCQPNVSQVRWMDSKLYHNKLVLCHYTSTSFCQVLKHEIAKYYRNASNCVISSSAREMGWLFITVGPINRQVRSTEVPGVAENVCYG